MLQTQYLDDVILDERGQGLVEYALVLPIFLMIVFFILDYSFIMYEKVSFDTALRDSVFEIKIGEEEADKLKEYLNPYGELDNRYGVNRDYDPYKKQDRAKYFYLNDNFLNGLSLEDYLLKEIESRNDSIKIDNIEFINFDDNRESSLGIYSGLQHYHYKKNYGKDGRDFESNPNFSTIIIAQLRVNYKIEPQGAFLKKMYPDGVMHEKVLYKASRNIRWRPKLVHPDIVDELDAMKDNRR